MQISERWHAAIGPRSLSSKKTQPTNQKKHNKQKKPPPIKPPDNYALTRAVLFCNLPKNLLSLTKVFHCFGEKSLASERKETL